MIIDSYEKADKRKISLHHVTPGDEPSFWVVVDDNSPYYRPEQHLFGTDIEEDHYPVPAGMVVRLHKTQTAFPKGAALKKYRQLVAKYEADLMAAATEGSVGEFENADLDWIGAAIDFDQRG